MKMISAGFFLLLTALCAQAQTDTEKITDSIVKEGKRLYRSEMASWYGTDIFLERYGHHRPHLRGYFSFANGEQTTCVFFSRDESPKVLVAISFDSSFNTATAMVDSNRREFSAREKEFYTLRKAAADIINKDTLFKAYQNTNLNLIPLLENGERKVYVLTGPTSNDVVLFGNDYLLRFDPRNNLVAKKQLHKNLIPVDISSKSEKEEVAVGAVHTHLPETGDFITATDVCTLMLYKNIAKWKQHVVIGEKYVTLWDCEKDSPALLSREAWNNMVGAGNN